MTNTRTLHDPVTVELIAWIQQSVERIRRSVDGLTEAQVRAPAAPSGWTVAGLVGHVHDSTCFWLHNVIAGHPVELDDDDRWDNDPDMPFSQLLERLRTDTDRAFTAIEHLPADAAPGWWPEGAWGGYRQTTVRGVLLHLFNDNVAHTGHLDIAREQIDGGVWDYGRNGIRLPDRNR